MKTAAYPRRVTLFGIAWGLLFLAAFSSVNAIPIVNERVVSHGDNIERCASYGWPFACVAVSTCDSDAADLFHVGSYWYGSYWRSPGDPDCHVDLGISAFALNAVCGVALLIWIWGLQCLPARFSVRTMLVGLGIACAYLAGWHREERIRLDQQPYRQDPDAIFRPSYTPLERLIRTDLLWRRSERLWGVRQRAWGLNRDQQRVLNTLATHSKRASPQLLSILGSTNGDPFDDLSPIGELRSLEFLQLCHLTVRTEDCGFLASLRGLRVLKLAWTDVDNQLGKLVLALPHLTGVDVRNIRVGDEFLRAVLTRADLTALDVGYTEVTDQGTAGLARSANLERLSLEGTRVTSTLLTCLQNCPRLTHLNIARTRIAGHDLHALADFPGLEALVLDEDQLSGEALEVINSLPQLRRFTVVQRRPNATALQHLRNPRIRHVVLSLPAEIDEEELKRYLKSLDHEMRAGFLSRQQDCWVDIWQEGVPFGRWTEVGHSLRTLDDGELHWIVRWKIGLLDPAHGG